MSTTTYGDKIAQLNWQQVKKEILAKTLTDAQQALAKSAADKRLTLTDFQALISPAAEPLLEQMAQQAMRLTQQRFGKTIQLYVPLYLSNMCSNICSYCGFSMHNKIRRTTLSLEQVEQEFKAIKRQGFDHLLLVTGEAERLVGMDYFEQVVPLAKRYFSHLSMEVQPLEQAHYQRLIALGLDAVLVYQETYHRATYAEHHLKGKKADFDYRLATADRLGKAGINKIGIGCLIGLDDWRTDCFHLIHHLDYLEKTYWQTRLSISFPRLRPCAGGIELKSVMSDKQLVQFITACRLFNPEVELSLSTRESEQFRNNVLPLGITTMSAGSSTQPGGYADPNSKTLEQFEIADHRQPAKVADAIRAKGYQPIWKDWERIYG